MVQLALSTPSLNQGAQLNREVTQAHQLCSKVLHFECSWNGACSQLPRLDTQEFMELFFRKTTETLFLYLLAKAFPCPLCPRGL